MPALPGDVPEAGSTEESEIVQVSLCPKVAVHTWHGRGHTVGIQGWKLSSGAGFVWPAAGSPAVQPALWWPLREFLFD